MSSLLMMAVIIVVFYFFMIRPQQKRAKELEKSRQAMKKGDRVVTSGGLRGKIVAVKEDCFVVEIAHGVEVEVDKGSIFAMPAPVEKK